MRIYDRYIILLAAVFCVTTVILATSNAGLDVYFSVYLIECLAATLLFSHLNANARRGLSRIGFVLFGGFMFLVAAKVVEIISGIKIL